MSGLLKLGIGIAVFLLVIAYIVPIAMTAFVGADQTGWTAGQTSVWDSIPTLAFVGLLLAVVFVAIVAVSNRKKD